MREEMIMGALPAGFRRLQAVLAAEKISPRSTSALEPPGTLEKRREEFLGQVLQAWPPLLPSKDAACLAEAEVWQQRGFCPSLPPSLPPFLPTVVLGLSIVEAS